MNQLKPGMTLIMNVITLVCLCIFSLQAGCKNSTDKRHSNPDDEAAVLTSAEHKTEQPSENVFSAASADSLQSMLRGKWLREDGSYVIEVFSISADGKMDAGYFNPGPINVGKAGWMISNGNLILEIILKDMNYPGSRYNLLYDAGADRLAGNYFQAVQGINYNVVFKRIK